jgi:hypothetical protein
VDAFEGLTPGEFDFAPTLALRFEHRRPVDVSSEFDLTSTTNSRKCVPDLTRRT